jgi:hypothetical protein
MKLPVWTEYSFWSKVEVNGPTQPHMATPCWEWFGYRDPETGYGRIHTKGKKIQAHRMAFILAGGVLTEDRPFVLHRCDSRACVNPDHLFPGNHAENMADMKMKSRGRSGQRRGELNSSAKLTASDVDAIRHLATSGLSQVAIGRRFGVRGNTVCRILSGKRWGPQKTA